MIRLFISTLAVLVTAVTANAEPTKVAAAYNKVYAPGGYDSNDHIQIVGEGMFRNTCYRPASTTVRVDAENKKVFVGPAAYEYPGFCLQVVLPFERVIDVGLLKPGTWEVVQETNNTKLGLLNVKPAVTESPDDFTYAPVNQAFFRQKGLVSEIDLTGEFSSDCMTLDEVKVSVEQEAIVIQPIAKFEENRDCTNGRFPFSQTVKVDLVPKGRYLLHVRSMNANAVNALVNVQ